MIGVIKNKLNPVAIGASIVAFVILSLAIFCSDFFVSSLNWIQTTFVINISWFYVLVLFFLFCVCLFLAFGPYRKIRLGNLSRPRFNTFTWIAMLFSAGMGTGLVFSGVYEPLYHYIYPPFGEGGTAEALKKSFQLTFLHWGFSGWAGYTFMGLVIAYFCFYKGKSFRISSMLEPILKDKTQGMIGHCIDIFVIIAVLFGVATTLGRGALQINSGLKELFNVSFSSAMQAGIIIIITLFATASVLSGLKKGIRRLSEINIFLCLFLLLFVLIAGPTTFLLNTFIEETGRYLQNIIANMTLTNTLGPVEWRSQWTILYWAWWLAWTPFVGLFIARISEGRTIQEFVIGSLIIPTILSCVWFTVFGGTAIEWQLQGTIDIKSFLKAEYSVLLFKFLTYFPFAKVLTVCALVSVILFFVTSSDSASYVIHRISSRGSVSSVATKVYWCFMEGILALLLVFSGGIKSLELLTIVIAFPFTILLLLVCYCFFKELRKD